MLPPVTFLLTQMCLLTSLLPYYLPAFLPTDWYLPTHSTTYQPINQLGATHPLTFLPSDPLTGTYPPIQLLTYLAATYLPPP